MELPVRATLPYLVSRWSNFFLGSGPESPGDTVQG